MNINEALEEEDEYPGTDLDFTGIPDSLKFTRADFLHMAQPDDSGTINFNDFAGWLRIKEDGVYVNIDYEKAVRLTPMEARELSAHPSGNLLEPALGFPFTVGKLKKFLIFTSREGWDFPLLKDKFTELVNEKKYVSAHIDECPNEKSIGTNETDKNRTNRKNYLIKAAIAIWESNPENNFNISEMANLLLKDLKFKNKYPPLSTLTIKNIIRPFAPESCKRPGRPLKNR